MDSLLYYILANVVEGKAADTLLNCPDGYGLECWRRFARNAELRTRKAGQKRLLQLMEPHVTGDFYHDLDTWEKQISDYERLHAKEVDADMKMAVLAGKLAPGSCSLTWR